MSKILKPQFKIVQVLWQDANSLDRVDKEALDDILKYNKPLLAPYWTVGYLIADKEEYILVSQAWLPKMDDEDTESFRRVLAIPKCQIIELKEIVEKKP